MIALARVLGGVRELPAPSASLARLWALAGDPRAGAAAGEAVDAIRQTTDLFAAPGGGKA